MLKESDILYEVGDFFVIKAKNGYEVYKNDITHSIRVAVIGWEGKEGFIRAKKEAERRAR